MGPEDLLLLVILMALTLYAILGGADFGAGIWEFMTALQSNEQERQHVYRAIGPVWEANHVWLIFIVVILMNGFPLAFAALSRALWLPLLLSLVGIVFRGSSYAFRSYSRGQERERAVWAAMFAVASTATPLFLGACTGAIAAGTLPISSSGEYHANYLTDWISPLAIFTAFYAVAMCAYLSAVYLAREASHTDDASLTRLWRQRALSTGLWMGILSLAGLMLIWIEAPVLADGFASRGWPLIAVSLVCGMSSLIQVWRCHWASAVVAASGAVAAVIWGWGCSQYPALIPPHITHTLAKAPNSVLWMMLAVIAMGAVLLLPSLVYLFILFKSSQR